MFGFSKAKEEPVTRFWVVRTKEGFLVMEFDGDFWHNRPGVYKSKSTAYAALGRHIATNNLGVLNV